MRKILSFMLLAVLATASAWADDLKITSIEPAAGSAVAGIAKGSYVKFATNMDDQIKGVTYTYTDKTTGTTLYSTFSTSYNTETKLWEIKNYSTAVTDFKKGHEIEFKVEGYDEARPSSTKIGEASITWVGDGTSAYEYSSVTVVSVSPAEGTEILSSDDNTFVITYSAPVEIDKEKSGVQYAQATTVAYESVTSNDDKTVWTLKIKKETLSDITPELKMNVYVTDADGKVLEGNTNGAYKLEDNSYYKYKFPCVLGSPLFTMTPAAGAVTSLKTFVAGYANGITLNFNKNEKIQLLKGEEVVAEVERDAVVLEEVSGDNMPKTATITLADEITEPGTYTLVVPSQFFNLDKEYNGMVSRAQSFEYTVSAEELAITDADPADGTEMANMPANFTVTFNNDAAVGYGKWQVINTATEEILTQGQLKKTEGVWGAKVWFNETLKMYEGSNYQLIVYPYAQESDQNDEENFGSNAMATLLAATWKGATKAYQFAEAELSIVTPSAGATIVSGEITAVFTAPVETLTADITAGVGGGNIDCQTTPSEDKMTWTITIPESLIESATGALSMNVYAKDADGKVVKGNYGEDAESYFVWEFNCYNGCPLPQKVTPATGSTVETIDVITIEDANGINHSWAAAADVTVTKGKQFICTIPAESIVVEEGALGAKPTKITATLPEAITTPGTYQINFPALYFIIGEEFDSKMTKNFTVEYTIEGEEPEPEPADVTIKTVRSSYMEITFKEWVAPSWNAKATVYDASGAAVAENCEGNYCDDWDDYYTAKIKFGTDLEAGDYTVSIPAGMFVLGENGESENEAMTLSFTIEAEKPALNFTSSPASGATVESIKKVTFTFPDAQAADYTEAIYADAVKNAAGETICGASLAWHETNYNALVWEAGQEITEDGTYTITIPAGLVKLDDVATTEDIVITLTIGEAPEPTEVNFTSSPADGSTVAEIKKVVFTFTDANEADVVNGSAATVVDAEGNNAVKMTMLGWGEAYNSLQMECTPVTDNGTYTITIPAGAITLDSVATTSDVVITLTVDTTDGINGINAEIRTADGKIVQNGQVVIYKNNQKFNLGGQKF